MWRALFVHTLHSLNTRQSSNDDTFESPLIELGLIKGTGKRDGFRFVRGAKSTLGDGVFTYALLDFWLGYSNTATFLLKPLLMNREVQDEFFCLMKMM